MQSLTLCLSEEEKWKKYDNFSRLREEGSWPSEFLVHQSSSSIFIKAAELSDLTAMSSKSSSVATSSLKPTTWVLPYKTQNLTDLYSLGRVLGKGQFGTTYLCTEISSGHP
ncbi:hypothetical protein COP2_025189 [Malus domestica]